MNIDRPGVGSAWVVLKTIKKFSWFVFGAAPMDADPSFLLNFVLSDAQPNGMLASF